MKTIRWSRLKNAVHVNLCCNSGKTHTILFGLNSEQIANFHCGMKNRWPSMKVFQRKSQRKGKMCTYQLCNKDLFQWIEYYVINATLSVNPLNLAHYSHSLCVYVSLRTQNVLSFTHSCDANSIKTYKRTTNSCEFSVLVQSPSNLVSGHRGAEYLKL